MSVYVDDLAGHGWRLRGRPVKSCHLFADSVEELVEFAVRIGLRASWLQGTRKRGGVPHFDLVASKRRAAVAAGAVEMDRRQTAQIIQRQRRTA